MSWHKIKFWALTALTCNDVEAQWIQAHLSYEWKPLIGPENPLSIGKFENREYKTVYLLLKLYSKLSAYKSFSQKMFAVSKTSPCVCVCVCVCVVAVKNTRNNVPVGESEETGEHKMRQRISDTPPVQSTDRD